MLLRSETQTTSIRVPCPGQAHRTGGACLVCDPETDGFIEVFLLPAERAAVRAAAQHRPVDANLARRLVTLGLLAPHGKTFVATPAGAALVRPDVT